MQDKHNSVLVDLTSTGKISLNWEGWGQFNFDSIGPDGIILFQFLVHHCARLDPRHEGWFYHTQEQIRQRTGIRRERQSSIIKILEANGILEKKLKGVPPKMNYRIRFDQLNHSSKLCLIYLDVSDSRVKELGELFKRCIPTQSLEKPKQTKAERAKRESADQLLATMISAFERRRKEFNDKVQRGKKGRVLNNVPLPTKPSHVTKMRKALDQFTKEQIEHGFYPYFDWLNGQLSGDYRLSEGTGLDNIEVPNRDLIAFYLSDKNDFDILRRCIMASTRYGHDVG